MRLIERGLAGILLAVEINMDCGPGRNPSLEKIYHRPRQLFGGFQLTLVNICVLNAVPCCSIGFELRFESIKTKDRNEIKSNRHLLLSPQMARNHSHPDFPIGTVEISHC